jgi:hypothetical protein
MFMDITGYHGAVRMALGAVGEVGVWADDLLDAGLRAALIEYQTAAPPVETAFITEMGGYEQSIGKLVERGLVRLAALAWPWTDADCQFEALARRWVMTDAGSVRFLDVIPAAGDEIRARYWRAQTIEGLDAATATTVPAADEYAIAQGAAGWAAHLRFRQLSEADTAPAAALPGLWQWQAAALDGFRRWLDGLAASAQMGRGPGICWPRLGL